MHKAWGLALLFVAGVPLAAAEFGPSDEHGWPINVDGEPTIPADVAAALDEENRVGPVTVYPYYPLLVAEVQRLVAENPDRVRLHIAGQTTLGLDIYMLEIADWDAVDAGIALPLEQREVVWVDGGTHSNEYSGVYFTLAWAQYLSEESRGEDADASWIVANRHTWIMPMVNIDGSHAMGRLNANLVNINRNYPVIWDGEGHDALLNNRGPSPASEVETQINIEWFNITQPDYYASVHCCGNLWLYPYGEEGVDPPADDHAMLEAVCDAAFPDVRERCGPIWSTIYPASGSSVDTAYEYTGTVGFGYEMSGRGAAGLWGAPFTIDAVREQEYESWDGLLHAFLHVHRYGAHPVVDGVRSSGGDLLVTVRNDGLGNLTAGTLAFDGREAPLPWMAPGASRTVRVPGDGDGDLVLEFTKRTMASPTGTTTIPLVTRGEVPAGGLLVASSEDASAVALLVTIIGLVGTALWRRP